MNREEYQKVKKVFQTALDLPTEERAEYLNTHCSGDPVLRREVEKLIDSFDSEYLETPAVGKVAEAVLSKANLSVGQEIGRYKIIRKIGAGGMGEVFLGEDLRLKRKVALKILPVVVSQNKTYLRRFEQEACAASALNHPNILTVHEFGDENGTNFIATEFVDGKTLRALLNSGDPLSMSEALDIAVQVASALVTAHEAGIIHRDIKPENIMIRTDGLVKVLDFGLAKMLLQREGEAETGRHEEEAHLLAAASPLRRVAVSHETSPGLIMGTASYMSPEQAQGKESDARSDIFSFGIVFFELLTGRRAFEGETTLESISSILKDEPPPISRVVPGVPENIERIVSKTLRKSPDERYQTAKDLLADLKEATRSSDFHEALTRVPHREDHETRIFAAADTRENQNQITAGTEYLVPKFERPTFRFPTIAVMLIAAIGLSVFGIYKFSGGQPAKLSVESLKITKVTDSGKVGERVALSRDGKLLAYSIVDGAKASLWLRKTGVPESAVEIIPPAETYYRELSFSPDAAYLFYSILESTSKTLTVYQIPISGSGAARTFLTGVNGGINFSPDGTQITYGVEDLENDASILMIANADGSEPRQLVKLTGNDEIASSRGRWSPDGKSIALWVGTNNPHTQELATVSVATGEITRLKSPRFSEFLLWEWLSDGQGLITLASEKPGQKHELWKISLQTGEAEKLTNDLNGYSSLSLSADSSVLATVQGSSTSHIWTSPVSDPAEPKQVTSGSNSDYDPQWTPDGKLVFERNPGNIYMVDSRTGNPQQLTTDATNRFPRVSPDGRFIVYVSNQSGIPNLWRRDIDGSNPKQLTTGFSVEPSISPDGKEVIYSVGVDASRIWKVGIDGGQPVQLTNKESRNAIFSPDGKQFICTWWEQPNSQPKIALVPVAGGDPVKIFAFYAGGFRWAPDGQSFLYYAYKDNAPNIWSQPIDGGEPKILTNFPNLAASFVLSSDGKQIAFVRGTGTSDVVLISGFGK